MWSIWLAVACSRHGADINDPGQGDGLEEVDTDPGMDPDRPPPVKTNQVETDPHVDTDRPTHLEHDTAADTAAASGADVYAENCVRCHGEDGRLGVDGASDLTQKVPGLTDAEITDVVRNGKKAMPAFALDDTDMGALLGYLRETFPTQP